MTDVTIHDRADLADLRFVEYRNHVENLESLAAKGKRPEHEVKAARDRLPIIEAQARTLRALADHPSALDAARLAIRGEHASDS